MKQEKSMAEQLIVCGKSYRILRLLGHGKGGYSYLAEGDGQQVVVKQIHHEPCDYYGSCTFSVEKWFPERSCMNRMCM